MSTQCVPASPADHWATQVVEKRRGLLSFQECRGYLSIHQGLCRLTRDPEVFGKDRRRDELQSL